MDPVDEFMMVDDQGSLKKVDIDDLKINAATTLADKMHDASLTLKQLFFLGMDDEQTVINKGSCTAVEVLQYCLEKKLALEAGDKDMIIMQHEFEYEIDSSQHKLTSTLILSGDDHIRTAMAKTVGLPMGIAAKLILNGSIDIKGLQIPIYKEIYKPVLKELESFDVIFKESKQSVK
jgi:saccharopine dehydrogenase-like NADP-dependent oxidoreductase